MATALLYEEPSTVTIIVLSSFLLLLDVVNYTIDNLIYCGLLGQIEIGVAWTQARLLGETSESLMVLLVYEGSRFLSFV